MCSSTQVRDPVDCMTFENSTYEKDAQHAVSVGRLILSTIGIWPTMPGTKYRILPKIVFAFCNLTLGFAIISCFMHMILEQTDFGIRLRLFGLLNFSMINMLKFWALTARRRHIRHCVEHIISDWRQVQPGRDREVMLRYATIGRNLTILGISLMHTTCVIYYTILNFLSGTIANERNTTVRPLVYPTYSVWFDSQKSPLYEIVYMFQLTCGHTMFAVMSGAGGLAAMFSMHACGQIEMLLSRLEVLAIFDASHSDSGKRLSDIIKYHLRILGFLTTVGEVLQEVCFIEFVGSTIMICLIEYHCMKNWEAKNTSGLLTYVMLLLSLLFNTFMLCYIGERLTEQTGKVGYQCFMSDWHKLPVKTARGLILIIAMSNNPVKLSAGKMMDLSLYTFGSIVKTSVAYLSFLRTII